MEMEVVLVDSYILKDTSLDSGIIRLKRLRLVDKKFVNLHHEIVRLSVDIAQQSEVS